MEMFDRGIEPLALLSKSLTGTRGLPIAYVKHERLTNTESESTRVAGIASSREQYEKKMLLTFIVTSIPILFKGRTKGRD